MIDGRSYDKLTRRYVPGTGRTDINSNLRHDTPPRYDFVYNVVCRMLFVLRLFFFVLFGLDMIASFFPCLLLPQAL